MLDLRNFAISDDPEQAFGAVVALRNLADDIERKAVSTALGQGWSWSMIAQALGVTKQAAHKRLSDITAVKERETDVQQDQIPD